MPHQTISRRAALGMLVGAAIGSALGACAAPAPTPTTASLAKATEDPTAPPKLTSTAMPPTPTAAPTATAVPTAIVAPTATEAPRPTIAPTVAATTIPAKPGTIQHFASAQHGFSFDYPGEWVPMQPKDQLLIADAFGVETVRLGAPEGPWLLARAQVLPQRAAWTLTLSDEIQMAKIAAGSGTVKLVSARALDEPGKDISGTDLTVEVTKDGGTYQSRQIQMRSDVNQFRVGFDVPKGPMAKHASGLDKVLSTLKAQGLPSFVSKQPWVDVPLG